MDSCTLAMHLELGIMIVKRINTNICDCMQAHVAIM